LLAVLKNYLLPDANFVWIWLIISEIPFYGVVLLLMAIFGIIPTIAYK